MPSRMDRYKEQRGEEDTTQSRIAKNEELYKNIYADREYSNIEGIASISKNNEIDLTKLKEMLRRKEQREERKYRTAEIEPVQTIEQEMKEQKEYDINEAIHKAKEQKKEDNRHRSLKFVDLDFLKSLDMQNVKNEKEEVKDIEPTSTTLLNKLGDKELSLEMLSELKSVDTTNTNIEENIQNKEAKEENTQTKKLAETSFFTTNNLFKKEDFEDFEKISDSIKKGNKYTKIIIILLSVVALALAVYLIINLWKG